jgi:hypothetical protein
MQITLTRLSRTDSDQRAMHALGKSPGREAEWPGSDVARPRVGPMHGISVACVVRADMHGSQVQITGRGAV